MKIGPPQPPQTSPEDLFCQSHLKLYWAARQAFEASESWIRDIKSQPDLMTLVSDDDEWLRLKSDMGVSVTTSMFVADSIHALRSALDYLLASLARRTPLGDERILFPFEATREAFEEIFQPAKPGKKLQRRAKELQALVGHYPKLETLLKRIAPYPKGEGENLGLGHALYLVAHADNADKHRFVALVAQLTNVSEVVVTLGNGAGDATISNMGLMGSGLRFPKGSKFKYQPQFTADVVFPKGSMLADKPVMYTLIQLIEFVGDTIRQFELVFGTK